MKKLILITGFLSIIVLCGMYARNIFYKSTIQLKDAQNEVEKLNGRLEIENGDIIFQTSLSLQSLPIQLATKSKYTHCGLIYKDGDMFYVFEAIQPVKLTPLDKWIARGKDGKYVIKRLKDANSVLTKSKLEKMKQICNHFIGKNYDLTFEWSDDKIYCSELIWKVYQRATGLEVGKLQKLKDFDLSNQAVQTNLKERYGENIPLEETVISPVSIFESELLMIVTTNE